jgi:hypothetical protein
VERDGDDLASRDREKRFKSFEQSRFAGTVRANNLAPPALRAQSVDNLFGRLATSELIRQRTWLRPAGGEGIALA